MLSFGVSDDTGPSGDLTYVVALMSQFNRYTSATPNAESICIAADCPLAYGFAEFDTNATGYFTIMSAASGTVGTNVTINQGDSVHWNLGTDDEVSQSIGPDSSSDATDGIYSGYTDGSGFTWTFDTPGTYYFYNENAHASFCTVTVLPGYLPSTAMTGTTGTTGMTGSTGMLTSTGLLASTGATTGATSMMSSGTAASMTTGTGTASMMTSTATMMVSGSTGVMMGSSGTVNAAGRVVGGAVAMLAIALAVAAMRL